ncbi:MAG: tRNA dihydrouridine synthase DusB [Clostridia bacterium]|nr:tRNA dihydrouridine synthase DusB [Clostridia bacterium]
MNYLGIEVSSPFFLAPMAGVTDGAFRTVCREYGAALTFTEMVSAMALYYGDKKTEALLKMDDSQRPCFAQIFGSDPEIMAFAAQKAEMICKPDGIDINMGCPMPKIVRNGDGSALMRDTDKIYKIVKAVKNAVSVPVTVKMRAGADEEHINAVPAASAAEAAGAGAVCVHGRTASMLYTGKSSRDVIADVKKSVSVPVLASGDIMTAQDALDCMNETGADHVMIARGARGNPFIFSDCLKLFRGENIDKHTAAEAADALLRQARLACAEKGEKKATAEMRKHALWYLSRIPGAKALKIRASYLSSLSGLEAICGEVKAL